MIMMDVYDVVEVLAFCLPAAVMHEDHTSIIVLFPKVHTENDFACECRVIALGLCDTRFMGSQRCFGIIAEHFCVN